MTPPESRLAKTFSTLHSTRLASRVAASITQSNQTPNSNFSRTTQRDRMSESTPRVNAQYLQQFSHQTVRILGKVRQLRGEQATIDAGGQIQVYLNRVSHCL